MKFMAHVFYSGGFGKLVEAKSNDEAFEIIRLLVKAEYATKYGHISIELEEIKEELGGGNER